MLNIPIYYTIGDINYFDSFNYTTATDKITHNSDMHIEEHVDDAVLKMEDFMFNGEFDVDAYNAAVLRVIQERIEGQEVREYKAIMLATANFKMTTNEEMEIMKSTPEIKVKNGYLEVTESILGVQISYVIMDTNKMDSWYQ